MDEAKACFSSRFHKKSVASIAIAMSTAKLVCINKDKVSQTNILFFLYISLSKVIPTNPKPNLQVSSQLI